MPANFAVEALRWPSKLAWKEREFSGLRKESETDRYRILGGECSRDYRLETRELIMLAKFECLFVRTPLKGYQG
jgi:hypothetical protein